MCTLDNGYDSKRLSTSFNGTSKTVEDSIGSQWLQQPGQGPGPQVGNSRTSRKVCYRICKQSHVFRFLQSTFPSSQAREQVAPCHRSQRSKSVLGCTKVQDGDPGINPGFPSPRGVGFLDRPAGCIPARTDSPPVQEIPPVRAQPGGLSVHQPSLWASNRPVSVHTTGKGGETHGPSQGHQTACVPGRLADQSPVPGAMPRVHPGSGVPGREPGMAHQPEKVRASAHADLRFRGLQVQLVGGSCSAHSRQVVQVDLNHLCSKQARCRL